MTSRSMAETFRTRRLIMVSALGGVALVPALVLSGPVDAQQAAQPAQVPDSPSGKQMPTGDLPHWKQIFAENFKKKAKVGHFPGKAYRHKWRVYPDGWKDTTGNGTYRPSKVVSVANGVLNKHLHTKHGVHMVAALLPKLPGKGEDGRTYGRYSVRFKADPVKGYKTAWLLWPDSEKTPDDGEIDFPEGNLDGRISAFMHHADPDGGQDEFGTKATYKKWHTATIKWTKRKVVFILDGKKIGTSRKHIPRNPMHQVLQTETSTSGDEPSNRAKGNVKIDWVVAYRPK